MQKLKRCKRRGCPHVAFYAGYCRQCVNPLIDQPQQPLRYWPPFMEHSNGAAGGDEEVEGRITPCSLQGPGSD